MYFVRVIPFPCWQRDNERYAIGIEYFNNWHVSTWQDVFRKFNNGIPEPDGDPISIYTKKHINTITAIFSRELFIGRHWVLEVYSGAGIKFRDVWKSLPDSTVDKMYHYHEGMIEAVSISESPRVTLDISAGVRFHWVFRRCPFFWQRD